MLFLFFVVIFIVILLLLTIKFYKGRRPVYIYIHVSCINTWKTVFQKLLGDIKRSGLYDKAREIRIGVLGGCSRDAIFDDPKISVMFDDGNLALHETSTINRLYEDAKRGDFDVLYLHTKGVTKVGSKPVEDWVDYMLHFAVHNHEKCIELLKGGRDAVGVNLLNEPAVHYSGNFWWSKTEYIRRLERCEHTHYHAPEFWLCSDTNGKFESLWDSGINHYHNRYPKSSYS